MDFEQVLALVRPLALPVLLYVGKWLKGQSWFANGLIPYVVLVLNGATLVFTQMGAIRGAAGGGVEAVPTDPEVLGYTLGAPLLAVMAWSIKGLGGFVLGTALQLGVEQYVVNRAHKGIKYRLLYKAAEASGIIPRDKSNEMRRTSRW